MSERLEYKSLLWLERRTYRTADRVVVSINESYKKKALTRGNHKPENVTVVGSEPDTGRMRSVYPDPRICRDAFFLLVYFGIMTPQGGEDLILEVMNALVYRRGRSDVHTAVLGFGDCPDRLAILQQQCHELELAKWVTFMGRADKAMPADYLSAADVGLCPDRKTPLNAVSTMNKAMEHIAYALPSVAFDLVVTTVSGGECTRYVESGDLKAFADEVERLLYNSDLRAEIGMRARQRVVSELDRQPKSMSRSLLKCAASRGHPFRGNRMLATSTPTKLRPRQACVFHQSTDRKRSVATPDSPQGRDARRTQAQRVPIKVFASLNLLFRRPFTRHDPAMPARRQCIRVDGISGRFGR